MTEIKETEIKQGLDVTMSRTQLTARQTNILLCGITKLIVELDVNKIEIDRQYKANFSRADLPRYKDAKELKEDIKKLYSLSIFLPDGITELRPITKKTVYQDGKVNLWLSGEYLKAFADKTKGYSVFDLIDIYKLNTKPSKRLFEILSAYKNRKVKVLEIEAIELFKMIGVSNSRLGRKKQNIDEIIKPSIAQINKKTLLHVNFTDRKNGRQMILIFSVKENKKTAPSLYSLENTPLSQIQKVCVKRMKDLQFTAKQIFETISQNKHEHFNKWWYTNQPHFKTDWSDEIARGKYYNTVKK